MDEKVAILQRAGVRACVGGTLLEAAWAAGAAERCLAWAAEVGFSCVEVSDGAVAMPLWKKWRLVSEATRGFVVIAEVGSKSRRPRCRHSDPCAIRAPEGQEIFPGHLGGIYQARSAHYLGRTKARTVLVTPDGQVLGFLAPATRRGRPAAPVAAGAARRTPVPYAPPPRRPPSPPIQPPRSAPAGLAPGLRG